MQRDTGARARFGRGPLVGLIVLALLGALLSGCNSFARTVGGESGLVRVNGSGNVTTREFPLQDFSEVEISSAFTYDVSRGDNFTVAITTDDNLADYLDVYQTGQTLHIGLKRATFGSATWRAKVTMPSLRRLEASGATKGMVSGFKSSDRAEFEVSGASRLTGRMEAGDIEVNVSGASTVELGGGAGNLRLETSGASRAELGDLPVNDVNARVSGASNATVNARGKLDAEVSGASTLSYIGNPTLGNTSTSGASSIKRR